MSRPAAAPAPDAGRLRRVPRRTLAFAVAALAWAGCDFGLVEPETETAPVRLWLDFQFLEPEGSVAGQIALNPGRDLYGRDRDVPDERLWVDGSVLDAQPIIGRALLYDVGPALRASTGTLRIVPPAVPDLPVSPDTVRVVLLSIAAPDTLLVPRTGQVEIGIVGCCDDALSAGPGFPVYRRDGSWRAVIQPDSAGLADGVTPVTMRVDGVPGPPLTIPASLLDPRLEGGSLEVTVSTAIGLRSPDALYEVELWQDAVATVPFRVAPDGG